MSKSSIRNSLRLERDWLLREEKRRKLQAEKLREKYGIEAEKIEDPGVVRETRSRD